MTSLPRDQPRPPASVPPRLTDPLLSAGVQEARRATRTTRTISRPTQRVSLCRQSVGISTPPPVRGRRRDPRPRRGLPERHPTVDRLAQRQAPCRSELRSTVDLHPDRKSTRLNSSHANISYAVFCLKKN